MRKTFKYRIYPTRAQRTRMHKALSACCWLYNHLVGQRTFAWKKDKKSISLYDQHAIIPNLKEKNPDLGLVHSQVLQNAAVRVDLAFKAFFRRCKAGEKPGYPRFHGTDRYDSFTYPQYPSGCALHGKFLHLSKIGVVPVILHRKLEGTTKTVTVKRSRTDKWYVTFSCEVDEPKKLKKSKKQVGIDVGLATFATLSNGDKIENPRFFREEEEALARVQQQHAKLAKGTPDRKKHVKAVARVHERITWRRADFAHQNSRRIVNRFGFIAVEGLAVNRMLHNRCLSKSISDAAWSQFDNLLAYKAEWAGRQHVRVNPAYTSQTCSQCGHRQKMPLSDRTYACPCCGLSIDRDLNAAKNILALGLQGAGRKAQEATGL
jgi:putative transposase